MEMNRLNFQIEEKDKLSFRVFDEFQKMLFEYRYEPTHKLAIQTWHSFNEDENIINIYKKVAKFAFENKQLIVGSITDLTNAEGSFDGTNEWLTREYMPIAVKYGFKFAAVVRSNDFFANLALEDLEAIEVGYTNKNFNNFEDSYAWIVAQLSK